jgi:hypothetical protein
MRIFNANASMHIYQRIADFMVRSDEGREMVQRAELQELNVLMSFFYFAKFRVREVHDMFAPLRVNVFADSGAFSCLSLGQTLRLGDYARWIHDNQQDVVVYANLDAIGDPVRTKRNHQVLEADGLRPLPVFHAGTDLPLLDELLERYDYMALGGMARMRNVNKIGQWYTKVFDRIQVKKPTMRVHAFGITTWRLMLAFPWFTVDSSSSISGIKFGSVQLFDPAVPGFSNVKMFDKQSVYDNGRLINQYGLSTRDVSRRDAYAYPKVGALGFIAMSRAEAYLTQRQKEQQDGTQPSKYRQVQ